MITVIKEEKTIDGFKTKRGVFFNDQTNEYEWLTLCQSGTCKTLKTAMKKARFTE